MKNQYRLETYQAAYWIGYFLLTIVKNSQQAKPYPWWMVLLADLLIIGIVYTIVYIFTRVYLRPLRGSLVLLLTFLLYAMLYYLLIYHVLPGWGYVLYDPDEVFRWQVFLFGMFLHFHHAMVEAGLLAALYRVRRDERERRRLLVAKHRAETQFLMAQMEPHEQLNMLDIVYAKAVPARGEAADILIELRDYMRFVTVHAAYFAREIPLADELAHVRRILSLYRRRYGAVYVAIDESGRPDDWCIIPLSLSALFKNVFKHGRYWEPDSPVTMRVEAGAERLRVAIRNRSQAGSADGGRPGVGNANVASRLELMYESRAQLRATEEGGWYEVVLAIDRNTQPSWKK